MKTSVAGCGSQIGEKHIPRFSRIPLSKRISEVLLLTKVTGPEPTEWKLKFLVLACSWKCQLPIFRWGSKKGFLSGVPAALSRRGSTEALKFSARLDHLTGDNWQVTVNSH